jgi:hypothetical protein
MEKELPPGVEVVTRRLLLDRMEVMGLREGLEPWLLDLLLAPDGHWTDEQKQRAAPAWEAFAVLDWALGRNELRTLAANAGYRHDDVRALFAVRDAEKLPVLPAWELRPARDQAASFFWRCWTELVARGEVRSASEEDMRNAKEVRASMVGEDYTGDYLIGAQTIAEIGTDLLRLATQRSHNRWRLLSLLVDVLGGDAPQQALRQHLAHFFAPAAEDLAEAQ